MFKLLRRMIERQTVLLYKAGIVSAASVCVSVCLCVSQCDCAKTEKTNHQKLIEIGRNVCCGEPRSD